MMNRNLKTLGLALIAAFALTVVVASAASAANYTASAYPTTGTGTSPVGNDTLTTEAGKVECNAHFEGTLNASSSTSTLTAKYTGCRAFGFLEATTNMGSCKFLMGSLSGAGDNWSAGSTLKCANAAEPVTITAGTCKITMAEQIPGGSTTITNNTAAGHISFQANASGITYTVVSDGFGCPFNGTGVKTGATYVHDSPITYDSTNGQTIDVG